jgi:hypothetical protein
MGSGVRVKKIWILLESPSLAELQCPHRRFSAVVLTRIQKVDATQRWVRDLTGPDPSITWIYLGSLDSQEAPMEPALILIDHDEIPVAPRCS